MKIALFEIPRVFFFSNFQRFTEFYEIISALLLLSPFPSWGEIFIWILISCVTDARTNDTGSRKSFNEESNFARYCTLRV